MSTAENDLVRRVRERMDALGVNQQELARACGVSQPHISKVLAKKLKVANKTERRLMQWLGEDSIRGGAGQTDELHGIVNRLARNPRIRFIHIMQLLLLVESMSR